MITNVLQQARQSAMQLIPHLPRPAFFYVANRAGVSLPPIRLFLQLESAPIQSAPAGIFEALGPIRPRDLPDAWGEAYKQWRSEQATATALRNAWEQLATARKTGNDPDFHRLDARCAGVLLIAEGLRSPLGQALFDIAVRDSIGAFIAAHLLDLQADEIGRVLRAIRSHSELLFWLGSDQPVYRNACHFLATTGHDLYAGLAAAGSTDTRWFERLARRAATCPVAATTALVLVPRISNPQRERWIEQVMSEPRWAYETARWAMWTWPGGQWLELRKRLQPCLDTGRWWYHWHRDVEPLRGPDFRKKVDPLWCAELAVTQGWSTLPSPVRKRLWRRLIAYRNDKEALHLLRWCQTRRMG